jgi:hypothetical protein
MKRTSYSCLPTDDLITYALARDSHTEMEVELAQRLMLAVSMIEEEQERLEVYDPGRQVKEAS